MSEFIAFVIGLVLGALAATHGPAAVAEYKLRKATGDKVGVAMLRASVVLIFGKGATWES